MSAEFFRFSFAPLNPTLAIALNASSVSITCKFRGLVLIGSFNLGLTSMLVSLGYASVVYGRQWLEKAPIGNGTMQRLSGVSALATVCIGLGLTTVTLT